MRKLVTTILFFICLSITAQVPHAAKQNFSNVCYFGDSVFLKQGASAGLVWTCLDNTGNGYWAPGGGSNSAWSLTGNSGTSPSSNFIGTTDVQPLLIESNSDDIISIVGHGIAPYSGVIINDADANTIVKFITQGAPIASLCDVGGNYNGTVGIFNDVTKTIKFHTATTNYLQSDTGIKIHATNGNYETFDNTFSWFNDGTFNPKDSFIGRSLVFVSHNSGRLDQAKMGVGIPVESSTLIVWSLSVTDTTGNRNGLKNTAQAIGGYDTVNGPHFIQFQVGDTVDNVMSKLFMTDGIFQFNFHDYIANTNINPLTIHPNEVVITQPVKIADGTQAAGYVYTSDASGNATWQNLSTQIFTLPVYANDAAAGGGGLITGQLYQSIIAGDGMVKIKQ